MGDYLETAGTGWSLSTKSLKSYKTIISEGASSFFLPKNNFTKLQRRNMYFLAIKF